MALPNFGFQVSVVVRFLREHSENGQYVFSYDITISNQGEEPAQLLRRHWIMTDGLGTVREVEGAGVIGEQPVIKPGQSFSYSSWTHQPTTVGTMRGTYQMVSASGKVFDVPIDEFLLNADAMVH